ncbi:Uncharacterized protein dnm_033210 [Desulfonema magnum]|uniref:Uncharacterized protein n=1 Tax=Desulfonema magnum TaxID=45655 RepID=A0A975BKX6_9BACT|nr:Uncharacterized protein dnm_033210 [Desulfonema magnum]
MSFLRKQENLFSADSAVPGQWIPAFAGMTENSFATNNHKTNEHVKLKIQESETFPVIQKYINK